MRITIMLDPEEGQEQPEQPKEEEEIPGGEKAKVPKTRAGPY